MKTTEMMKMTAKELVELHNEKAAQYNTTHPGKVKQLSSWKAAKAALVERIEFLDSQIEPAEVSLDDLLDETPTKTPTETPTETPAEEKPPVDVKRNGKWTGTFSRMDDVDFNEVKESSKLGKLVAKCTGEFSVDELATIFESEGKMVKKQIRSLVRRGYILDVNDGKVKLTNPVVAELENVS